MEYLSINIYCWCVAPSRGSQVCHNGRGDPAQSIDYNIQETGDSSLTGLSVPPDIIFLYGDWRPQEGFILCFEMTIVVL